ncbi:MAG: hypothetical protein FD163_2503 [Hyphomonadaceae bacterium]|nr:MAG: hypothetical protein FD163_2503 [Hyphomonadaceae bacterium]
MNRRKKYDHDANRDQTYQFMGAISAWLKGQAINFEEVAQKRLEINHKDLRIWAGSMGISAWFLVGEFKLARNQFEKAAILASLDAIVNQWQVWKLTPAIGHQSAANQIDFKKRASGDYD